MWLFKGTAWMDLTPDFRQYHWEVSSMGDGPDWLVHSVPPGPAQVNWHAVGVSID